MSESFPVCYIAQEDGSVMFLAKCLNFDIILGTIPPARYQDITNACLVIDAAEKKFQQQRAIIGAAYEYITDMPSGDEIWKDIENDAKS